MMLYGHEEGLGVVGGWFLFVLAFLWLWGKIDGTDKWDRERRAEWGKHLPKNGPTSKR